ncbi:MAG TPA: hypothetical protein VJS37_14960 [Terriglobales bacterium]|nr:hypothetical protein [Terriglobales bacterium]
MKLGAENRNKVIAALALGVVAIVLLAFELPGWFGGSSSSASTSMPSSPNVATSQPSNPRANAARNAPGKKPVAQNLDPSLRFDVLKSSEETKYEGSGRNIFRVFVEPPPKPVQPVTTSSQPAPEQAYVPPPPPPIELKFYGFATPAGGAKRVFLAHAEDVFIAKEGDIVNRRYKVMKISPNSVDILDVLSNNRQTIPLTQG